VRRVLALLGQNLALALLALALNFFLLRLAPASPFAALERDDLGTVFTAEQRARLEAHYGLDRPLWAQFLAYFGRLFQGRLGESLYFNQPVTQVIAPYLANTAILVGLGFFPALLVGLLLALLSVAFHRTPLDGGLFTTMILLKSLPPYFTAMALLLLLAVLWPLFPTTATSLPGMGFGENLRRLFLPVLAYALWEVGTIYLVARGALFSVLGSPFVAYARAKGVPESWVYLRHILRAALPPLLARITLLLAGSLGGVFFVERVFAYPGLSTLALAAVGRFDYPLLEGVFLVSLGAVLFLNLLADLLLAFLDPRTREAA
jgi:peptide/nickel transport system permease protein